MKKVYLFLLALVCTVGAWAATITTDWVDYSSAFHGQLSGQPTSFTVSVGDSPAITLQKTEGTGRNYFGWATISNVKRPWLYGDNKFTISVAKGKIIGYELVTCGMAANGVSFIPFQFQYGEAGNLQTSEQHQQNADHTITVDSYDASSIVIDLSGWNINGTNQGLVIKELRLKLEFERPKITINVKNEDDATPQLTKEAYIEPGIVTLSDYLPSFSFVTYTNTTATVAESGDQTFTVGYTVDEDAEAAFPFVTSFSELNETKWVSMYTLNGRMHVRDTKDGANVAKYPTIDKATFTRLNDNYFWGFVRASRFSPTYIVNKAAGEGQTLYLTSNGNDVPVLLSTEANKGATWVTNEWVLETSTKADAVNTGDKYFGIRAQGTNKYINNNGNKGFMTTWQDSQDKDNGSNHKFIKEIDTYDILKERALNAPANAVHSLNAVARAAIKANTTNTVEGYKTLIAEINDGNTETGYIDFDQSKYYMLRNYTPENGNVYVLGSSNGTASCTFTVPAEEAGDADNVMTYSNVNAIWKITANGSAAGGDGLGASRTVPRLLTHVNSTSKLLGANNRALNADGANYYFVDLGAGQHFLKNTQYSGTGNQAQAKPLSCNDNGTLKEGTNPHKKNTRDAWYGIEVTKVKVTIGAAGYATLHLPFGVDLPESGLEAYVVSGTTGTEATMEKVTCIPANQGVILKGEANTTHTLTINDAAAWEGVTNLLQGTNLHANITPESGKTCYVLSMPVGATKAGFYKAELNRETNTAFLNNDNKAYLSIDTPADGEAPSLSFAFDTETSIQGIDAAKADNRIYDLSGRRVKAATKGIFIMGGKKVIK